MVFLILLNLEALFGLLGLSSEFWKVQGAEEEGAITWRGGVQYLPELINP
jgi:hypothetical protein